jgi:hypothetical protein
VLTLGQLFIGMIFTMEDNQFHTVNQTAIEQITVEDILTAKGIAPESLDYSVPVPISFQGIPHRTEDVWLQVQCGGIDPAAIAATNPNLEQYRGRMGGC